MISIIVVLLALLSPPPFTAVWQRPHVARLSWTQPANVRETCLFRGPVATQSVLIGCWEDLPAGATGLTLGNTGPMDAAFRPQAGDVFVLTMDGAAQSTRLVGRVLLPVFRG